MPVMDREQTISGYQPGEFPDLAIRLLVDSRPQGLHRVIPGALALYRFEQAASSF